VGKQQLKCPLNAAPCSGKENCKLWVEYEDFSGCVFLASEEILNRFAREARDFLGSPAGKTILSLAGAILGRSFKLRENINKTGDSSLPVPTKTEPR
jgi:hypothetical protein